jgi:hypothetical protein
VRCTALRLTVHPCRAELDVDAAVAPAGMGPAALAQLGSQRPVPVRRQGLVALGGAVLPDQPARPPRRDAEHPLAVLDGAASAGRAHRFPHPTPLAPGSGASCRPRSASVGCSRSRVPCTPAVVRDLAGHDRRRSSAQDGARDAEPDVVDPESRVAATPHRGPAAPALVKPPTATQHPVGAIGLGIVEVPAPLPHVA